MAFSKKELELDKKIVELCPALGVLNDNPIDRLTEISVDSNYIGIEHYDKWRYDIYINEEKCIRFKKIHFYNEEEECGDWFYDCEEELEFDFKSFKKFLKEKKYV